MTNTANTKKGVIFFMEKFGDHIRKLCQKYSIKRLWLFGSSLENIDSAEDYDFAVEGFSGPGYFKFYAELDRQLDKETVSDLIDLDELSEKKHPLSNIIKRDGVVLYES